MSYQTMYKAINGSPKTFLTAAITATDTTIPIDDPSRLPDAPNIAVLGTDIDAEVVIYSEKTAKSITGVTRGAHGTTAQAWAKSTIIAREYTALDHDTFIENIENAYSRLTTIESQITDLDELLSYKRYGVSGIEDGPSTLTRLYDAVGMVAEVGTDDPTKEVRNDFDEAAPFKRRKCVGYWTMEDAKPKFTVSAYLGDDKYTEDGSIGNYVAVECPLCFRERNANRIVISAQRYPGMHPYKIFRIDDSEDDLLEKVYLPAYNMALDENGLPVSLPDLDPLHGSYEALMTAARSYEWNEGTLGLYAMLMEEAVQEYETDLMMVEFATTNAQEIMTGAVSLRNGDNIAGKFLNDTDHFLTAYHAAFVVGQSVAITTSGKQYDSKYAATHTVTALTRCDANGNAAASGSYILLTVSDSGHKSYFTYEVGTDYYIASRPWKTGACNSVVTPSGSPVSNTDSYHPMRYRYRENIYGNITSTVCDLFCTREADGDSFHVDWYYTKHPERYDGKNPTAAILKADPFEKIGTTPVESYASGYIKAKQYTEDYPDAAIPVLSKGASATTFYCDQLSLVSSAAVRSVRAGGNWSYGLYAGPSYRNAYTAPSSVSALYGAHLYVKQG